MHLIVLESYALPLDTRALMPEEKRRQALAELGLQKRLRQARRHLLDLTPEATLRRGDIAEAKAAPPTDGVLEDVVALMSLYRHVVPAPPGSRAAAADPQSYAFALVFPRLAVCTAGLYSETPDVRIGLFWRGLRGEARGRVEALRRDPGGYDAIWDLLRRFPEPARAALSRRD